ncbi:uncharacterized protein LOC127278078 [Leptopilina boulardi]|uniref:uncharacterized protein LOC127278078 n=1 Tax=Leptopilina boulardi TaxID=63433 RepID=UPI0021F58479|nr:uncharacterized protein LOC127278078 [Leptopilina boulardi]
MPRKRKLLNLRERCRLCLTENGEMRDLFTEPYCLKLKDLSDCTSIEIKCEQNLPKNICHACIYKLESWNEFKERFMRSNRLLLTRLEVADNNEHSAILPKRKYNEQASSDENSLNENKKKNKVNNLSPLAMDSIFEDNNHSKEIDMKPSLSPVKKSTNFNTEKEIENNFSSPSKPSFFPQYRQIARRGRTSERRRAYARRWDARKKALIAATGNNTDTDSGASDNQLSPVQKARAKSNADKEDEKQKKIARALKNLETNMNDFKKESDSDTKRVLRSRKSIGDEVKVKNRKSIDKVKDMDKSKIKETDDRETEKENVSIPPRTVKSELKIGDSTYIVTSTLAVSEPAHFDKVFHDTVDQEKLENTDIIDAVQLKRISPLSNVNKDKIEKCLHIEIEGTEFEALQRVQVDLASFIEKDMKNKIFSDSNLLDDLKDKYKGSYDNLDQQLKTIVVKAIKKNYETSVQKNELDSRDDIEVSKSVSLEFIKAAMHSSVFQPKLTLDRLDVSNVPYKINNVEVLQENAKLYKNLKEKITCLQSIEDTNISCEDKRSEIEIVKKEKPKRIVKQKVETVECDTTTHQELQDLNTMESFNNKDLTTPKGQNALKTFQKHGLNHRCGICNRIFITKKDADEHMKYHQDPSHKNREKLMRCKRCHEIVPARFVKSHICSEQHKCNYCGMSYVTEKSYLNHLKTHHSDSQVFTNLRVHKCTVCDKKFNSEMQLVDHLSEHDDLKSTFECSECNVRFISEQSLINHLQTHNRPDFEKSSKSKSIKSKEQDVNVTGLEKRTLDGKLDNTKTNVSKKHEGYTCFVCDKKFSDEEVMKDHLQQHCDDISEDEQSSKEHYQCAICSESLESEDALSTHVENHLFDDGDDNPNLISITDGVKQKDYKYYCDQCPEVFSSKSILEMHKENHDEESDAMVWEKERNNYSCTICDEVFSTENELADHLDIHNESSHICLLCEKTFSTLLELQTHVETH